MLCIYNNLPHLVPVREAFYEDTKGRNSRQNAMLVHVLTLKKWLEMEDDEKKDE